MSLVEIEWRNGSKTTGWKAVLLLPFGVIAFSLLALVNQAEITWRGKHVYGKSVAVRKMEVSGSK